MRGLYAAFRGLPDTWPPSESVYTLTRKGQSQDLDDVSWADWDSRGRLLVATRDARIQIRSVDGGDEVVFEHDLKEYAPDPQPAPDWASEW